MSKPNHRIFEKYDDYWWILTDNGDLPVPDTVESWIRNSKGQVIETRTHPIKELEKDQRWMTNYSQVL